MFAKTVRILFGCLLTLFGAAGVLVGIVATIDPVGTKMADDADPFGVPPTFTESFALTVFYLLILILGINLISNFKWIRAKFLNNKLR